MKEVEETKEVKAVKKSKVNKNTDVEVKKDHILKDYWKDKRRFADLFNGVVFRGKDVVDADKLHNEDSANEELVSSEEAVKSVERFRDVVKMWTDDTMYVVLGVENQMKVHYAMPVRTMMYDAMNYTEQIKRINSDIKDKFENRIINNGTDDSKVYSAEYLSGIRKDDKIYPVVTLVLYYSDEEWDGPISLYDMMNIPEDIKPLVPDYKINLVNVREVDYTGFSDGEVKCFFELMKQLKKGKKLEVLKELEKENVNVSRETLMAVGVVSSSVEMVKMATNYKIQEGDEVSMLALDEWVAEAREDGEKRGIEIGENRGISKTLEVLGKINRGVQKEEIIGEGYSEELYEEVMATVKEMPNKYSVN